MRWIARLGVGLLGLTALTALTAHPAAASGSTVDDWTRGHPADVAAATGTFTVTPTTGLPYTARVAIDATGYPPGALFGALECVAGATDIGDCAGSTLVLGNVDDSGAFHASTTVRRFVTTTHGTVDCAAAPGTCVVAGGPSFADALLDRHPLTFDPGAPIPPPPAITASPASGLGLVAEVTVTGSGFEPFGTAAIQQCVVGTSDFVACGQGEYGYAEVDASGHFRTTLTVRRGIRTFPDPVVDCARAPGCELVAYDPADPARLARARLTFDAAPLPPPPAVVADPSTGLADRQLVTVSATGFAPGQLVYLGQCAAGSVGLQTCGTVQSREADLVGAVSLTIRVRRSIGFPAIDCQAAPGTCVAFAAAVDDVFATGSVPLTFDPDALPVPPPTITVDPTVGLHDGQSVTVTGSGFTPGEQVALVQCRAEPPDDSGRGCDLPATLEYRSADESGAVHTTFTVHQYLQTDSAGTVDCALATPGCIIGWAGLSDSGYERGRVDIRFATGDGGNPPPPPTPGTDPPPPPAAATPGPLAMTGADPRPTAGLGLALVLVGTGCLLLARGTRRTRRTGTR